MTMVNTESRSDSQSKTVRAASALERELADKRWYWKNELIDKRRDLTPATKLVADKIACLIDEKKGHCAWAGADNYAKRAGIDEKTVRNGIDALEAIGAITVESRGGGIVKGGRGRTMRIYLAVPKSGVSPDFLSSEVGHSAGEVGQSFPEGRADCPEKSGEMPDNNLGNNREDNLIHNPSAPAAREDLGSDSRSADDKTSTSAPDSDSEDYWRKKHAADREAELAELRRDPIGILIDIYPKDDDLREQVEKALQRKLKQKPDSLIAIYDGVKLVRKRWQQQANNWGCDLSYLGEAMKYVPGLANFISFDRWANLDKLQREYDDVRGY
jgi:hypothetical protein